MEESIIRLGKRGTVIDYSAEYGAAPPAARPRKPPRSKRGQFQRRQAEANVAGSKPKKAYRSAQQYGAAAALESFAGHVLPGITINRKTGRPSKASQLRRVRAKRAIILDSIAKARASGLRDGTIARLKVASKQLRNQSRVIRGV